jgi:hypothetical protein
MNRLIMIGAVASMLIATGGSDDKAANNDLAAAASGAVEAATDPVSEALVWSFGLTADDGQTPIAVIADKWGNLFGTTVQGGTNVCQNGIGCGTVFELTPPNGRRTDWTENVLWNFGSGNDGEFPQGGVIADNWGNLYGTTFDGGANAFGGTVFELSPPTGGNTQWRETMLWSFGSDADGGFPTASLFADNWGNLYGTTTQGGVNNRGTVFELSPPVPPSTQWREKVLWSFGGAGDGISPGANLIADRWGNFYSTTGSGGANTCPNGLFGCGTVFELSPSFGQNTE